MAAGAPYPSCRGKARVSGDCGPGRSGSTCPSGQLTAISTLPMGGIRCASVDGGGEQNGDERLWLHVARGLPEASHASTRLPDLRLPMTWRGLGCSSYLDDAREHVMPMTAPSTSCTSAYSHAERNAVATQQQRRQSMARVSGVHRRAIRHLLQAKRGLACWAVAVHCMEAASISVLPSKAASRPEVPFDTATQHSPAIGCPSNAVHRGPQSMRKFVICAAGHSLAIHRCRYNLEWPYSCRASIFRFGASSRSRSCGLPEPPVRHEARDRIVVTQALPVASVCS